MNYAIILQMRRWPPNWKYKSMKQEKKNLIQIPLFKWGKSSLPVQALFYSTQNFDISMNIIVENKQKSKLWSLLFWSAHYSKNMAENKILLKFVLRNSINKDAIRENLFITASCVHSLTDIRPLTSVLRSSKHVFWNVFNKAKEHQGFGFSPFIPSIAPC